MAQSRFRIQVIDVVDGQVVYYGEPGSVAERDFAREIVDRTVDKAMELSAVRQVKTGMFGSEDVRVVSIEQVDSAVATALAELLHDLKKQVSPL